jgi:hypothetical protein
MWIRALLLISGVSRHIPKAGVAADRSICLSRFVSSNEFCTCYYHITLCYGKAEMQMYTAYQWNMQYTKVVTMHVQTCNPCVGKT